MSKKKAPGAKLPSLIVKSAVRKYVNSKGCNIASEVVNNTLNKAVRKLLDKSMENAANKKRKTVKPSDVVV